MYRNSIRAFIILIILFCLALPAKSIILGGATVYSLPPGSSLSGIITQSIAVNSAAPLPVEGKDFSLKTTYFYNGNWAVGLITPLTSSLNPSVVILQLKNGTYQVVVPPSNAIANTELFQLPTEVGNYVKIHEAVYNPVAGS